MKKRYLIYLLTLLMVFSPAAAFADAAETAAPEDAAPAEELQDETSPAEEAVSEEGADEVGAEDVELVAETSGQQAKAAGEDGTEGETQEDTWATGWNESKTKYKNDAGVIQTGLFKGRKQNGSEEYALFHADSEGNIEKRVGTVTVSGLAAGEYFIFNGRAFDYDKDQKLGSGPVTYYQKYDSDSDCYCMDETSGIKDCADGKFFLQTDGTVKTTAGLQQADGKTYYIQDGGKIVTTPGWVDANNGNRYYLAGTDGALAINEAKFTFSGKTWYRNAQGVVNKAAGTMVKYQGSQYYTNSDGSLKTDAGFINYGGRTYLAVNGGAIRTTAGPVDFGGKRYIAEAGGAIHTAAGFFNAGGKKYYSTNNSGVIAINQNVKVGGKTYHALGDGSIAIGVHKWGKSYYYSTASGALRKKAGVVKWNGNYYHVSKSGKVTTNKKVKYKGKTYIAAKNGAIYRGIFTWKKNMYYASKKGVLRTKAGLFKYDGFRYYSRKGGKLYRNGIFKAGGKKYLAQSNGRIKIGFFSWKNKYYMTNGKGAIITKAGIYSYKNKLYYIQKGGVIARNDLFEHKDKYYYAGNDGALLRKAFKYKGYWWHPNSKTGEISLDEYVRLHPEAAPQPVEEDDAA